MRRRLLDLVVCQHLDAIRVHAPTGWRFYCARCGRSVPMLDRDGLAPPVPKFVGYDAGRARAGCDRARVRAARLVAVRLVAVRRARIEWPE